MSAQPRTDVARSPAYRRIEEAIAAERCVILDGGTATELQRLRPESSRARDGEQLWDTWALNRAPQGVLEMHRSYVETGCDVISTNTWSILSAPGPGGSAARGQTELAHWIDVARLGTRLARRAVNEAGRAGECAVAFAISEDVDAPSRGEGTIDLLARAFETDPPDLILLETLTLIREPALYETVDRLLDLGLPLWLSFRRCRHGVCGVHGQHWGPPEGDLFGRAARRFEQQGVGALLLNCLPVEHVPGMISWLRDFTSLPLGVYPNLGHLAGARWRFDDEIDPEAFAELARGWRDEGAQLIGGCCGTTPEHIRALVRDLAETKPGHRRPGLDEASSPVGPVADELPEPWVDDRGRDLFPLPLPELVLEAGVFVPTLGSFLVWKHIFRTGLGKDLTCLDVGCGSGILTIQLALNGARTVHGFDIDREAAANTLSNAFRNGVADRVTSEAADMYEWETDDQYDVIVASLFQMPVDPFEEPSGHRPLDYWGRNLLDHFIEQLPTILAVGGVAYVMQLSIIGQARTEVLLRERGLRATVIDFTFFPFGPLFLENAKQIERVEEISDAYHVRLADQDVMVAYLLEVRRA